MIAGSSNVEHKQGSIHYFDYPSNKWYNIGDLNDNTNTPVCDIYTDKIGQDWVWCETPRGLSKKQKIQ